MGNIVLLVDITREIPIETNQDLFLIMDYVSIVGSLINLTGLYVIAFHTPKSMKSYGRALCAYQIISLITDSLVGSALAPYFVFPIPGGLPMGWMWRLGISTQIQIGLGFMVGGHMISLIMTMFLIRHQTIMPDNHRLKLKGRGPIIVYIFLQIWPYAHVFVLLTYVFYDDDPVKSRGYYLQKYPILTEFLSIDRFYAFEPGTGLVVCFNITLWAAVLLVTVTVICSTCFHVLHSRRLVISARTYNLQKKWIHKCIIQVAIPLITVFSPIVLGIYMVLFDTLSLIGLIPFGVFILAEHGVMSTIITMALYRPYYAYIEQIVWNMMARILPNRFDEGRVFSIGEQPTMVPRKSVFATSGIRRLSTAVRLISGSSTSPTNSQPTHVNAFIASLRR